MQPGKPSKRLDLQGIRGLAIIVVLGFHFYPNIFPNGYLGVDQFFVLSGFLMCMLLKRGGGGGDNMQSCSLITLFYSKRFKRILPLYLLIILLSLLSLYYFFPETAIENNQQSATKALLFVSNRPKTDQEDYFQQLSIGMDIYTHTWSLSVEIQFYFIVPFLFIIGSKFHVNIQYAYYTIIGLISFIFYSISNSNVSFNSVFARIWQFMIGMLVYLLTPTQEQIQDYKILIDEEEEEEEDELDEKLMEEGMKITTEITEEPFEASKYCTSLLFSTAFKYLTLFSMLYLNTYPIPFPIWIARPYVTILTGLLMLISMDDYLLSNRILTYIGDISYSLYLIHWPIYAYWKLTMNNNQILLVICLSVSVILAVISYELFEKWYLKLSSTSIGIIVIVLFAINIILINKDNIDDAIQSSYRNITRLDGVTDNMTLDDAEKMNYKWNTQDNKNIMSPTCVYENRHGPLGWCNHTGLNPKAKNKIVIFGNSWTANHATMFYQECGSKANTIYQGAAYGCEPLYPSGKSKLCTANFTDFADRIQTMKPDYGFMFTRFISIGDKINVTTKDLKGDEMYEIMKKQMKNFTKNINKKLFILAPMPPVSQWYIKNIVKDIKSEMKFEDIDKKLVSFHKYDEAKRRYDQLFKDCGNKCERISYLPEFWNNDTQTYRYFDDGTGFSYFTSPHHLSPHGIEKVRHIYTDICKEL